MENYWLRSHWLSLSTYERNISLSLTANFFELTNLTAECSVLCVVSTDGLRLLFFNKRSRKDCIILTIVSEYADGNYKHHCKSPAEMQGFQQRICCFSHCTSGLVDLLPRLLHARMKNMRSNCLCFAVKSDASLSKPFFDEVWWENVCRHYFCAVPTNRLMKKLIVFFQQPQSFQTLQVLSSLSSLFNLLLENTAMPGSAQHTCNWDTGSAGMSVSQLMPAAWSFVCDIYGQIASKL